MTVKVELCWNGKRHKFRLTLPDGSREWSDFPYFNRPARVDALNLLENVYHLDRRKIRFQVR